MTPKKFCHGFVLKSYFETTIKQMRATVRKLVRNNRSLLRANQALIDNNRKARIERRLRRQRKLDSIKSKRRIERGRHKSS